MVNFLIKENPSSLFSVPITMDVVNVNFKKLTNEMLKKILYNYGPIYVTIETKLLKFYPQWPDIMDNTVVDEKTIIPFEMTVNGILGLEKPSKNPNLATLLIGYGKSKKGLEYWILKNCWSQTWGHNGFYAIYFFPDSQSGPLAIFHDISYFSKNNLKYIQFDTDYIQKIGTDPNHFQFDLKDKFEYEPIKVYRGEKKRYGKGYKKQTKEFFSDYGTLHEKNLLDIPKHFNDFLSYSHKDHNRFGIALTGPVYDQGLCGIDWALSGCQLLSSAMTISLYLNKKVKKAVYVPLSFQYLIQRICFLNKKYFSSNSDPCSGGNINLFNYAINGKSLEYDYKSTDFISIIPLKEDPYRLSSGKCNSCECPDINKYPVGRVPKGKKNHIVKFRSLKDHKMKKKDKKKKKKKEKIPKVCKKFLKEDFTIFKRFKTRDKYLIYFILFLFLLILVLKR